MTARLSSLPLVLAYAALSGCALLGGGKPAQLYRLSAVDGAEDAIAPPVTTSRTLLLMPVRAAAAVDGDRILASRGSETSYIAGARWVTPLGDQLEQALRSAVRLRSSVILLDRRDGLSAPQAVQITISRFEARFADADAAPEIVVEGEAQLIDLRSRQAVGRLDISARSQAASSDIGAVVAAFNAAAADAVGRTADWMAR